MRGRHDEGKHTCPGCTPAMQMQVPAVVDAKYGGRAKCLHAPKFTLSDAAASRFCRSFSSTAAASALLRSSSRDAKRAARASRDSPSAPAASQSAASAAMSSVWHSFSASSSPIRRTLLPSLPPLASARRRWRSFLSSFLSASRCCLASAAASLAASSAASLQRGCRMDGYMATGCMPPRSEGMLSEQIIHYLIPSAARTVWPPPPLAAAPPPPVPASAPPPSRPFCAHARGAPPPCAPQRAGRCAMPHPQTRAGAWPPPSCPSPAAWS